MGNSALIVVIASVLSGVMILLNIQRIDTESSIVQTHMEEEVLARELAHTGLSLALANLYTGSSTFDDVNFELNYQGGFIDVDNFVDNPVTQELQFDVYSEFGNAQYLIHSRYQYAVNFPFAMYLDVPQLNLLTTEESTIYGGADSEEDKFYLGTSEFQRLEDQEGLSGLIDLNSVEQNINDALDDAWDGLPGEITEVSVLNSDETFSDQLPDIDPNQENPWLHEFYFQTLDNINEGVGESLDRVFQGPQHLFGSEVPGEEEHLVFGLPTNTAIVRVDGDMTVKAGSSVSGHGILLVEGDLVVEPGAALDWSGIVYLRPESTHSVSKLDGSVNINGALVAFQEALPLGSHMDVTSNRDLSGDWKLARGIVDGGPKPIPGPWFVHRHKWDTEWKNLPPVSIDREVLYRNAFGPNHEYNTRFNETLSEIASSGVEKVQLEFVNPGQGGMGVYSIKFADSAPGELPKTKSVAGGFSGGNMKSPAFAPNELVHFSIFFRSLRMLKLMRDPKDTPFTDDGPHRVTDNHDREGVFHVRILNADTNELLYTSSVYQHIRETEDQEYQDELDQLKEDIQAGNFGLTIDMGPGASIRYDNVAAAGALGRTNYTSFSLVGTWTQRCNGNDYDECDLALNQLSE